MAEHFRFTGLCVFLCCMGGVLLWVSGGSNYYYIRGPHGSVGLLFLLWLVIYALTGLVLACILLTESNRCVSHSRRIRSGILTGLCVTSYLFMLCWYAVYFCTRLVLFSGILLTVTMILFVTIFVVMRTGMILAKAAVFLAETGQILCMVYCYSVNLLK